MLCPCVAIAAFSQAGRAMKAGAIEGNPFEPKRELFGCRKIVGETIA